MPEWIECTHGVKIEYCSSCSADYFEQRATTAERERDEARAQAVQYKSDAIRFETERDAAIDSAEYYKHTHLSMQTTIDELTAQLATAQAERDAGCTWKRRYDKQGYPIYDSTCDIASEPGEVEFSGFNFCPYCGKKIAVVLESKP